MKPTVESTSDAKPVISVTNRLCGRRRRWAENKRLKDAEIIRVHMQRHENQEDH